MNGHRTRAEGLNAQKYSEWIITGQLKPLLDELRADERDEVLVVEDGTPAHRAAVSMVRDKRGFTDENLAWPDYMPLVLLSFSSPGAN